MDAVSFEYASPQAPLIIVDGRLGAQNRKAKVVIDTGATAPFALFLSVDRAKSLGIALSDEITPETSTAIGQIPQTYREATLPAFSIGPVKRSESRVAVLPMIDAMASQVGQKVDAIVGYEFLRTYRFSIDYPRRKIDFTATAGEPDDALPFTLGAKKPMILVMGSINGTGPFTFEIDTGATITTLSPDAAERAGVVATGDGLLGGAGGAVAVKRGDAKVSLGRIAFDLKNIAISDSLSTISAAAGSQVDGIIGLDYLYRTTLTIDYPAETIWIK